MLVRKYINFERRRFQSKSARIAHQSKAADKHSCTFFKEGPTTANGNSLHLYHWLLVMLLAYCMQRLQSKGIDMQSLGVINLQSLGWEG